MFFSTATNLGTGGVSAFSGGTNGLYPYLTSFFSNGVQAISGTAQTAAGANLPAAQVGLYGAGALLGGGTVSSGANGAVYQIVAAGTLSGTPRIGATVTPAGGTAVTGLVYTDAATVSGSVLALGTITAGRNGQTTAQTTFSGLQGYLAATFGTAQLSTLTMALSATPTAITATGVGFTFDRAATVSSDLSVTTTAASAPITLAAALNAGTNAVTLTAVGAVKQGASAPITAGTLRVGATGGIGLTAANQVATVASLSNAVSGGLAFPTPRASPSEPDRAAGPPIPAGRSC